MDENIKWVEINGYNGLYFISEYGDIYSVRNNIVLKKTINKHNGYVYTTLHKNGDKKAYRVHKLVALHFLGEPSKAYLGVGHKDNNKTNNHFKNLYWTTYKENTQKAVNDGLLINDKAEQDSQSKRIKVLDKETNEIVGVYGSIRQCERCVDNITLSTISKLIYKDYKPRTRKYKYQIATEEEFLSNTHLKDKYLIESKSNDKKPIRFRMINDSLNIDVTTDNQTSASKICGIKQAVISHLLKTNGELNGWKFIKLEKVEYVNSSSYDNFVNTIQCINVKNVYTGEIKKFKTGADLKKYFKLSGNDLNHYRKTEHLILQEWKIIE